MKLRNALIISLIMWTIVIFLIITDITGILSYEDTRYVFYALIIFNSVFTWYALRKNKDA